MESGRQSRQKSQRTRLTEAITNGRLYQTKMILSDFTNLNYLDDDGCSPLMRACMIEDAKHRTRSALIRLLVHHRIDVNLRDKHGLHVLNWACKMNKLDLVTLLLERCLQDVDITSQDLEGNTPLIYAVINNNVRMVELLLSALKKFSLSVDHRNKQDKTAYLTAHEMGFEECASILSKVGKASQEIKVNPFLDFLTPPTADQTKKIRARSAPLAKEYGTHREKTQDSKKEIQKNTFVSDSLFQGKRVRNKKKTSKLLNSRRVHSVATQKANEKNSNMQKQYKEDKSSNDKHKHIQKGLATLIEETYPVVVKKKDQLLRLILDESQSHSTSGQQSPQSNISRDHGIRETSSMIVPSDRHKPVIVNGYFTNNQPFHENNEPCEKAFPTYHSYLVWRASLNDPPNTLRRFLAMQTEQRSDSYRKGIAIPKYDPTLEDSACDRSGGATSPASESSSRSEAGRKISAVAKTVGLSIYLSNKRKNSYRKNS